MSYFIFDGVKVGNLEQGDTGYEADVFPVDIDATPARQFEVFEPIGRIGNIIIDNQRYADVEHSYYVVIRNNADETYHNIAGFLQSRTGYCRLSDSFHTTEFYKAYVSEPIEPVYDKKRQTVKFVVTFTRQPQRFLTSGEESVVTTTSEVDYAAFTNPTPFAASPKFTWTVQENYASNVKAVQLFNIRHTYVGAMGGIDYKVGFASTGSIVDVMSSGARVTVDFGAYSAYKTLVTGERVSLNRYFRICPGSVDFPGAGMDFFTLPGLEKKYIEVPAEITNLQFYPGWWRL